MSDIDTTTDMAAGDTGTSGRLGKAKNVVGQASQALKEEAQSFATAAQERARTEAQRRTETATKTLGDFANAIRRAGDELGQADQSPAARLVRQAADGLESFSRNLAGKQPEDLLDDVRSFARRNPAAFIGGAVLVGVALGRFVRSSETAATGQLNYGDAGVEAYPAADAALYAGNEATGAEALGLAEEDGFDGESEYGGAQAAASSAETSLGDDLGDLTPSDVEDTSTGMPGQSSEQRGS